MAEKTRVKVEVKAQSRGEKNRSGSHKLVELNELAVLNVKYICTKYKVITSLAVMCQPKMK